MKRFNVRVISMPSWQIGIVSVYRCKESRVQIPAWYLKICTLATLLNFGWMLPSMHQLESAGISKRGPRTDLIEPNMRIGSVWLSDISFLSFLFIYFFYFYYIVSYNLQICETRNCILTLFYIIENCDFRPSTWSLRRCGRKDMSPALKTLG